jgi:PHP domain/PHP-associated
MGVRFWWGMTDLDRYLAELHALGECSRTACEELAQAEKQTFWAPTRYEVEYLPGLRKVGLASNDEVALQNVADLHIHTTASDGGEVAAMLERASVQQLDAVAVTDHDTIEGALEARRFAHRNKLALAVIPGVEVSTSEGHVGALFVMQAFPTGLSMHETIDLIHEAGGLAVAHHPFVPATLELMTGQPLGVGERFLTLPFDAVEVTNAVPGIGTRSNIRTHQLVREAGCTLGFTGGSDAHHPSQVGKGLTFYAGNQGVLSLRRGIELGTTMGAEAYWTTVEKFGYYARLVQRVFAPSIPPPPGVPRSRIAALRRAFRARRSG